MKTKAPPIVYIITIMCIATLISSSNATIVPPEKTNCKLKPIDESFAMYMDNPSITLNEFFLNNKF